MATAKIELYKGKKLANGSHPIMLRISHQKRNKYIYMGASVKPEQWIGEPENWVVRSYPGFKRLNLRIDNSLNRARNIVYDFTESKTHFCVEDVARKLQIKDDKVYFGEYASQLIKDLTDAGKNGNAATYQTTTNVVKEFMKEKDIPITSIDHTWLTKFETYKLSKGVTTNGISVYLRTIRAIYNKSIKDKLISRESYPFGRDGFQIQNSPTSKRAITKDDINRIRALEFDKYTTLWHTKNYFLFSFYARGMNWVDMAHLKMKNISNGRINYIRAKTSRKTLNSFSIGINNPIKEILDLYTINKQLEDYIFPIILRPDSVENIRKDIKNGIKIFNKRLKTIANSAKIEASITSYTARHSWGTIGKKLGVDINVISDGYGHSDPSVTKVYLASIEDEEIDKANELIIK